MKTVFQFVSPTTQVICSYLCEISPKKQDWLIGVMHPDDGKIAGPCVFKDILQMGGLLAECARHPKSETGKCVIPTDSDGVHLLVCGRKPWSDISLGACTMRALSRSPCRFRLIRSNPYGHSPIPWIPEGSLAHKFRVGIRPISCKTWPPNLSRTTGLVLQCRLHQKSPQRTNFKAISWRQKTQATLPSGTRACSAEARTRTTWEVRLALHVLILASAVRSGVTP